MIIMQKLMKIFLIAVILVNLGKNICQVDINSGCHNILKYRFIYIGYHQVTSLPSSVNIDLAGRTNNNIRILILVSFLAGRLITLRSTMHTSHSHVFNVNNSVQTSQARNLPVIQTRSRRYIS